MEEIMRKGNEKKGGNGKRSNGRNGKSNGEKRRTGVMKGQTNKE